MCPDANWWEWVLVARLDERELEAEERRRTTGQPVTATMDAVEYGSLLEAQRVAATALALTAEQSGPH